MRANEVFSATRKPEDNRSTDWLTPIHANVGTAYYGTSYLCTCGVWLQIKVGEGDIITEARCAAENCNTHVDGERLLGEIIRAGLVGKTLAEAAAITNDAVAKRQDIPWFVGSESGCCTFAKEAIHAAIVDWAGKDQTRLARLPFAPETPEPLPPESWGRRLLRRFLRNSRMTAESAWWLNY